MKILNLYGGIGGNRKKWGTDHQITAVEIDNRIAEVYMTKYPQDSMVIGDAHGYLEQNYKEFDFIWSSPPCPSHGQYRHNIGVLGKGFNPVMPDMTLYSEIIFLKNYFKGDWIVENVKPYYDPLVAPDFVLNRHLFWSNFHVKNKKFRPAKIGTKNKISDFDGYEAVASSNIKNKRQVLRNCVDAELGLHILQSAMFPESSQTRCL